MRMIANLVRLPLDLFQERVNSLFVLEDLVCLDSALLNHRLRDQFLQLLVGALINTKAVKFNNSSANWFLKRNLFISSLHVASSVVDLSAMKPLARRVSVLNFDNCTLLTDDAIRNFLASCENAKHISLGNVLNESSSRNVLEIVAECCHELESINLSNISGITPKQLTEIAVCCPNLIDVNLGNGESWVDVECINVLAVNCPQLRRMTADGSIYCGDSAIQVLAQHCRDLRHLSVRGWYQLTDAGIDSLAACTELRALLLDNTIHITTFGMIKLARACPKLEEIGMPQCGELVDLAIAAFAQHCPALCIVHCASSCLSDNGLQFLQSSPLLHTLEITNAVSLTTTALSQLINHCVYLQRVVMSNCQFSDPVVSAFASGATDESSAKAHCSLQVIEFKMCSLRSDFSFVALMAQCPNITELSLRLSTGLTEAAVVVVATHCTRLRILDIVNIPVSDNAICALARGCPELRNFNASGCDLSDISAVALAENCPFLRHLYLSYWTKLTDDGVVQVLQKCHQLRELMLNICNKLTSRVLGAAVQYGARLRKLDVSMCSNIDAGAVTAFRNAKPDCEILGFEI